MRHARFVPWNLKAMEPNQQEFEFSVGHRAGRLHNNAGALSRRAQSQSDAPIQIVRPK